MQQSPIIKVGCLYAITNNKETFKQNSVIPAEFVFDGIVYVPSHKIYAQSDFYYVSGAMGLEVPFVVLENLGHPTYKIMQPQHEGVIPVVGYVVLKVLDDDQTNMKFAEYMSNQRRFGRYFLWKHKSYR